MYTDAELIARVLVESDRESYSELIRRHQSPIRSLFHKLTGGDSALADDLSQETFITAYKALSSFKGHAKFLTWLFAIAKNIYLQNARKHYEVPTDEIPEDSHNSKSDTQLDVQRALKHLEPDDRLILSLCYAQELTHTEVAEILQIPLGTVKTNVLRAKEKLKSKLISYERSEI